MLPDSIYTFLTGAWILVNETLLYANGTYRNPLKSPVGAHPVGLIIYSPNGYMSANIMATEPDHRPPGLGTNANASDADWANACRHLMAYAGPYNVKNWTEDGLSGTLVHGPLTFAWATSWVGKPMERNFTVLEGAWRGNGSEGGEEQGEDDMIKITVQADGWPSEGGRLGTLWWRRGPRSF